MRTIKISVAVTILLQCAIFALAQSTADYLILQDIGNFKFITQSKNPLTNIVKQIPGYSVRSAPGMLAGADHFDMDHDDKTYEMNYDNSVIHMGVEVQVTQHASSDSDQWLAHELERDFRNYYGLPGDSYVARVINGNTILAAGSGGWDYRWLSGNKVIHIEYTDLQMTKSEPLEVVNAYLAKHPSTLSPMTSADLRTAANKTTWIKDEMTRRLWLCDKWVLQIQTPDPKLYEKLKSIVDSMIVFINYREKYFGIAATNDKNLINGYLEKKNDAAIRTKLAEYKTWWTSHKNDAITLP